MARRACLGAAVRACRRAIAGTVALPSGAVASRAAVNTEVNRALGAKQDYPPVGGNVAVACGADGTAAIQAALTAGGSIVLPACPARRRSRYRHLDVPVARLLARAGARRDVAARGEAHRW